VRYHHNHTPHHAIRVCNVPTHAQHAYGMHAMPQLWNTAWLKQVSDSDDRHALQHLPWTNQCISGPTNASLDQPVHLASWTNQCICLTTKTDMRSALALDQPMQHLASLETHCGPNLKQAPGARQQQAFMVKHHQRPAAARADHNLHVVKILLRGLPTVLVHLLANQRSDGGCGSPRVWIPSTC
jgi:hypothetical protein